MAGNQPSMAAGSADEEKPPGEVPAQPNEQPAQAGAIKPFDQTEANLCASRAPENCLEGCPNGWDKPSGTEVQPALCERIARAAQRRRSSGTQTPAWRLSRPHGYF